MMKQQGQDARRYRSKARGMPSLPALALQRRGGGSSRRARLGSAWLAAMRVQLPSPALSSKAYSTPERNTLLLRHLWLAQRQPLSWRGIQSRVGALPVRRLAQIVLVVKLCEVKRQVLGADVVVRSAD